MSPADLIPYSTNYPTVQRLHERVTKPRSLNCELLRTPSRVVCAMNRRRIPSIEQQNDQGACWTCLDKGLSCDGNLPVCSRCLNNDRKCAGYGIRLQWPETAYATSQGREARKQISEQIRFSRKGANPQSIPTSLSLLNIPPLENGLLQHFLHHISSIALAVDYTENGYRMLLPLAAEEPALLNAMLAVASAHRSKWQQLEDKESQKFLRKTLVRLQEIMGSREDAVKETTLATILCLVSYEVFNGTGRWKQHFQGVGGWLKLKGDCSDLNPFLKTWVCMIDTQAAMNLGQRSIKEVDEWLNSTSREGENHPVIDPLFGCSTRLPLLMLEAARIYHLSQSPTSGEPETRAIIRDRAETLKGKIIATALDVQSAPLLAVSCGHSNYTATMSSSRNQRDRLQRMCATAEIFRHALLIYLFRVVNGGQVDLDDDTQRSLDQAFDLLPLVPDAVGPGANLGWALVVIGSETDSPDLRQYIRCRWRGLNLLELNNTRSGEKLTEEVWSRRDVTPTKKGILWLTVMQDMGGEQILV